MGLFSVKTKGSKQTLADAVDLSGADEAVLMQRIIARDEAAFGVLYHQYYKRLHRFINRMTSNTGATEEAINDTLYVVWDKAETFRAETKLSTWIFGIAYNKALKVLEKNRKGQFIFGQDVDDYEVEDQAMPIEQMEVGRWLSAGLAQLSPVHRTTVELSYHFGMSYNEIADIMDCSANTAKTRMFYARKKLRIILPTLAEHSTDAGDQHDSD